MCFFTILSGERVSEGCNLAALRTFSTLTPKSQAVTHAKRFTATGMPTTVGRPQANWPHATQGQTELVTACERTKGARALREETPRARPLGIRR